MVEYHGWLMIAKSLDGENEQGSELIYKRVKERLREIHDPSLNIPRLVEHGAINGYYRLIITGDRNHFAEDVQDAIDLFRFVANIAIGSYGLLYIRNDEDPENENQFVVWKLAKGRVTKEKDPFLSPCNPMIEVDLDV